MVINETDVVVRYQETDQMGLSIIQIILFGLRSDGPG